MAFLKVPPPPCENAALYKKYLDFPDLYGEFFLDLDRIPVSIVLVLNGGSPHGIYAKGSALHPTTESKYPARCDK